MFLNKTKTVQILFLGTLVQNIPPPKLELNMENLETLTQDNPHHPRLELLLEHSKFLVQNTPYPLEDFVMWTDVGDYCFIPQGYRLVC